MALPARPGTAASERPRVLQDPDADEARSWRGYAAAAAACAVLVLVATPLAGVLELSNIVMLFLLLVVGVGLRFGRGPAVLAAFLGVVLFDLFFVSPRFSLAVSDVQYLVTFAVMPVMIALCSASVPPSAGCA